MSPTVSLCVSNMNSLNLIETGIEEKQKEYVASQRKGELTFMRKHEQH